MFGEENVNLYYKSNFSLMSHGLLTLNEIDNLIPFERDIYTFLLIDKLKKESEAKK
jgi:hypothetical protein